MRRGLLTIAALVLAAACGSSGNKENGPAYAVGDAGVSPGGTRDAGGAADAAVAEGGEASVPEGDGGLTDPGPFPLGATWGPNALHFRVRADAATALELDVYAVPQGADAIARFPLTQATAGGVWGVNVPHEALGDAGLGDVVYYGYRAWGPNWPQDPTWTKGSSAGFVSDVDSSGNRYDPNKLLIDPYTHEISHDPLQPSALSGTPYTTGSKGRAIDDGQLAPKSIVTPPVAPSVGAHPTRALKDDVIYEVNVRGLTMNDPSVPAAQQGTYAGAATKAAALAALGVTAIELEPIHETQNDQNDAVQSGQNYWGYSTLAYFAPDRRYSSDKSPGGPTAEFQAMVSAFHAQGIKVFLDVVYNHTAEGGTSTTNTGSATLYSFRGLDNAGYYELSAGNQTPYDDTGVGGNFGTGTQLVRDLVIDSLTYWSGAMGVDGFRFDLAAVLGNSCTNDCFQYTPGDPKGILLRAVNELPARPAAGGAGVDLIAEPWGVGTGTYQLGNFPTGWSEWNGEFRDGIRQAQNQLGVTATAPSTMVLRLTGSPDLFEHDGRAPAASINFVDCHDGFTLHDEYAYSAPDDNQAYPYGPSSGGSTSDYPWDQGVADGGSPAPQVQAARTGLAIVALSTGVPMIQGGDEMLRTQYGNNNAYNLDDSAMWLDWSLATTNASFVSWTSALFAFRAAHPALRPAAFFDGTDHDGNGLADITWLDNTGNVASSTYLGNTSNHFLAWRVNGTEAGDAATSILVVWNGWTADITMPVPKNLAGVTWWSAGDSASGTFAAVGAETAFSGTVIDAKARSVAVLIER